MSDLENTTIETETPESSTGYGLELMNPGDGGQSLTPFSIQSLNRHSPILALDPVLNAFDKADKNFGKLSAVLEKHDGDIDELDESVKFLLNTRDIANQMIVTALSTWYYDNDEVLHTYSSLRDALVANETFSGKINYAADVELTGEVLNLQRRKLIIDLQGHTLSCARRSMLGIYFGSEVTIQNGTIYAPRVIADTANEYKFQINRAKLILKNIHLDLDGSKNRDKWYYYRIFNLSQQENEMLDAVGKSELELDRDCIIRMHDCNLGEALVCSITPYNRLASCYANLSKSPDFLAKYPTQMDYQIAIRPIVTVDADIRITRSENNTSGTWPSFISGNGQDFIETIVNIEKHCRIFAEAHGLYLGNNGILNINGGYIVAGTGICMRSGKLVIPRDANPTIIGIAKPKLVEIKDGLSGWYDPYHTKKESSAAGKNLNLGHAILLENNGMAYGKHEVEADIQSGTFISYNNTAIGSYGIAQGKDLATQYRATCVTGYDSETGTELTGYLSSTYNSETVYFCRRPTHFADGIQISRRESQQEYDYYSGSNPDFATALSSDLPQLNAVKFEVGHQSDLTTDSGLKQAVKDILVLLGDKPENIIV